MNKEARMDWTTKFEITRQWSFRPDQQQQSAVKAYLITHPGISTSDDWWLYLARLFGLGKMEPGYLDLEGGH